MSKQSLGSSMVQRLLALAKSAAAPEIQVSRVSRNSLMPSDIPADWVKRGHPAARTKYIAHAEDGGVNAALWDCTAGTFEWYFGSDELVHILEGGVEVESEDGTKRTLKPGDVAYFQAGTKAIWHVPEYVKKLAVLRDNKEPFTRKLGRKLSALIKPKQQQ